MGTTVFGFDDFGEKEEEKVLQALKNGDEVKVVADCIGHTRAEMVERWSRNYFKSVGALVCERDWNGNTYKLEEAGEMRYFVDDGEGHKDEITKDYAIHLLEGNYIAIEPLLEIEQKLPLWGGYVEVTKR